MACILKVGEDFSESFTIAFWKDYWNGGSLDGADSFVVSFCGVRVPSVRSGPCLSKVTTWGSRHGVFCGCRHRRINSTPKAPMVPINFKRRSCILKYLIESFYCFCATSL